MTELLRLVRRLRKLSKSEREMLVVRSMPFGDLIDDWSRQVHFSAPACKQWPKIAYRVVRLVKTGKQR